MEGNLWFIIKLLPYLAFCCIVSGFVGWTLRARLEPASRSAAEKPNAKSSHRKARK
jgi:hypothetical protein